MHLIIPMSGIGKRFIDAGYTTTKALVEIDGMPIIQHVLNLFRPFDKVTFICNNYHLHNTNMKEILLAIWPTCEILEVSIDRKKGPVDAIYQHINKIDDDGEIIVSYCDYGTHWDYQKFLNCMREKNADGGIPCYIGFHPHMLGKDNYAFVKHTNMLLEKIQEKQPFTNNKMGEYASNGTYYFKNGKILKKYFTEMIQNNLSLNGEFYVSLIYNLLTRDNLKTYIYEIDNMLQWGTPYDLECYKMWSDYFKLSMNEMNPLKYENVVTILPMAGKGNRFKMDGYVLPKPLLPINDLPMVIQAVDCLPKSQQILFVGLKEHFEMYPIQQEINKKINNSKFDLINDVTNGQSTTCMVAINNNNINDDTGILISACDNGVYYNVEKYDRLIKDTSIDVIIWSFSNHPTSLLYPHMYAWLDVDDNDNLIEVSNKKPFQEKKRNKCCIIGTMFFRKCKYFREGYKHIIDNNIKTNNEYYVDDMINYLIEKKYKVKVFNVDYYLCWGTPNDYKTFLYWQQFFEKCWWHPYRKTLKDTNFVAHRINSLHELQNIPQNCGIEIDLRDSNGKIIVTHDPFTNGIEFENYIKNYKNKNNYIILNIKSEGIEFEILNILKKYDIAKYFFLDSSFPMIYKLARHGIRNIAIRYSEFEPLCDDEILELIDWIWIDCFTKFVYDQNLYDKLNKKKIKSCLVSPDLQGREFDIEKYAGLLVNDPDMICCKLHNLKKWRR